VVAGSNPAIPTNLIIYFNGLAPFLIKINSHKTLFLIFLNFVPNIQSFQCFFKSTELVKLVGY